MLTAEQIKARSGKLTASRVSVLMKGDAKGIHNLWLEMTGQEFEQEEKKLGEELDEKTC